MAQHVDEQTMSNKSIFGWKGVLLFLLFAGGFLGLLFFAMSNEPDYMPSQRKAAEQKAAQANTQNATVNSASAPAHDMANMQHDANTGHAGHSNQMAPPASAAQ
ncbi:MULTISPECIES: hypothetical protein [unclassified Acinetobacter]|uniref:hypothetical protein n=1 Tax=unclassified Acinetobacter TaxID=196816 RepID=UPI0035B81696